MNRSSGVLAVLAALALAGCSAPQPSPSGTPTGSPAGVRITRAATIPDVHVPGELQPVAGTGDRFVIEGENDDPPGRYSLDSGRTWQDAPAELSLRAGVEKEYGNFIGYGGVLLGVRQEPEPDWSYTGFQRWDPATGKVDFLPYDLDLPPEDCDCEDAVYPIDYTGTYILLDDSRIFDVSGSQASPVEPRLPQGVKREDVRWGGITRNGEFAVGRTLRGESRLVLGALGQSAAPRTIRAPGVTQVEVSADRIHYLVSTAAGFQVCHAETATPTESSCVRIAGGSGDEGRLSTSDGADLVTVWPDGGSKVENWFIRRGRATRMPQNDHLAWMPYRDAAAPVALLRPGGDAPDRMVAVADDGGATDLFAAPAVPASATGLAVAANRVAYSQRHVDDAGRTPWRSWNRSLDDGVLGDETLLTDRMITQLLVSGDRTGWQLDRHFEDDDNSVIFYDGAQRTGAVDPASTTTWLADLSGPYARLVDDFKKVGQQIVRVDGRGYDTGPVMTSFGSLVVEASDREPGPGVTFAVRDLARPEAEPVPLDLPDLAGRTYRHTDWLMWGDWVVASYETPAQPQYLLFDYRTGQTVEIAAGEWLNLLGDGWIVFTDQESRQVRLRVLATGEEVTVVDKEAAVSSDGVRTLAWEDADGAVIAAIEGLPASVPRLLGALGADVFQADGEGRWQPQFDLTTPVGAGVLTLADSAGEAVATVPLPAGPSGSIRGVSWDGRGTDGELVSAGDYSWTLDVDGAVSVDGLGPASGRLTVTR